MNHFWSEREESHLIWVWCPISHGPLSTTRNSSGGSQCCWGALDIFRRRSWAAPHPWAFALNHQLGGQQSPVETPGLLSTLGSTPRPPNPPKRRINHFLKMVSASNSENWALTSVYLSELRTRRDSTIFLYVLMTFLLHQVSLTLILYYLCIRM